MAPLNVGGCSRAQTRTFCPHFKTILEHFAAFSSSGSTSRSKADRADGELETLLSVPGMLFDFTPECCSACPGRRSQERENAAKCPRIVLKCGRNVRVCAREQPPALSGAIWNQHLARSERVFLQRTPKTANKTLHSGALIRMVSDFHSGSLPSSRPIAFSEDPRCCSALDARISNSVSRSGCVCGRSEASIASCN